ncbi:MAG: recombination protein O N-terminal domain-containing protein [Muribaculaceae bacterium]|nr:recombination protein O N-terminal domain-containing protein [Muribaculaceae bacterium]
MIVSLDCIALRMVRYNDRTSILTVYSRQRGRLSLAIAATASRAAARTRALVQPMGVFECRADIRPDREIVTPREIRAKVLPASGNPLGAVQAMFAADMLSALLREPHADDALFSYLEYAAMTLSAAASVPGGTPLLANFHLALLLGLTRATGIEPDWSTWRTGSVFDMNDGVFKLFGPAHASFLPPDEATAAYSLRRMSLANAGRWRFSRNDRNRILDRLTTYFQIHYPSVKTVSAEILRQTFSF